MDVHKSNYIKMEDSGDEGADMEAGSSHFDILKDNAQKKIQETFDAIMELEPVIKVKKYSKTLVAVVSFFLLTMLISIVISYSKSSNHGLGTYTTINRPYKSDMSQVPANFTGLAIYGNITSIDSRTYNYKVHFGIFPKGSLLDEQDELARSPRGAITLVFDSHTERFPAGQIMASPDLLFTFKTGNPITYPFDEYESDFFIM